MTGTFGKQQNGVGRFIEGLEQNSFDQGYPLQVYSSGDHLDEHPRVHNVRALSFPVPDYSAIEAYYPLEGKRDETRRAIKGFAPDIMHLSTPDALGITGLGIAEDLDVPAAAVYHTDFPQYARRFVHARLLEQLESGHGAATLSAVLGPLWQTARAELEPHLSWLDKLAIWVLRRSAAKKREQMRQLLSRGCEYAGAAAEALVGEAMHQFYRRCELVLARSNVYREHLVGKMGLDPDKVKTLQYGVDTAVFSPDETTADAGLRERLGVPPGVKVVLYVGRVSDEKNVSFLADAWQAYTRKRGNGTAVLVVVGSGDTQGFAQRAGKNVIMAGPKHGEELSAIYRMADAFWSASRTETLGQVAVEAQASGTPVLVSNEGAIQESVSQGTTGFVLPLDSPQRWADSLERLLGNQDRLAQMGAAARAAMLAKTIRASYEHFWELHAGLQERIAGREKLPLCGQLPILVSANTPPPVVTDQQFTTTHISDFHAGHGAKTKHKEGALHVIGQRARSRGAELHLHGDFSDTRPKRKDMRAELKMFRKIMREYGLIPKTYIEGNHDYEFARSGVLADLVGCEVHPSLVTVLNGGLVVTHGHVSELRDLSEILKRCTSQEQVIDALSVRALHNQLKQAALEYDLTAVFEHWVEDSGLDGIEDLWRNIFPYRRRLADAILAEAQRRSVDTKTVGTLVQLLGSKTREEALARLGTSLGGWGVVYGHTHEPHITPVRAWDPVGNVERSVLLGNSGSMRRRRLPPTWLEVDGKTMSLFAYDANKDREVLVDRKSAE